MPADANRPFGPTAMPERGVMLIVDDDAINCAILETIFSPYYATATAPDGRAGLEAILEKQDSLCAVLLDVIMPEMDGIQVLHALAERGLLEKIPVFLITAEASGSVMKEAYALGVMDVISKPVIPYVVLRRVQSVVELFRARERLSNVVELQQADLLARAKKIISLNRGMIEALAAAIEFRSEESGEHVRRIHDITRALLTSTPLGEGLSRIEIEQIALASIMHDVGKIAVPDAILNKPGRLTAAEFEVMKSHTVQGARLLEETLATARKSEKAKLAFFNNMSHDMRTPLNAILGVVDLLRQHTGEPDKVREYAEKIAYSGRQLLDLVNDILDMSRMEQGKVVLNNEAFDLAACVKACTDSFIPQARRENKDFAVHCEITDSCVMGDATRITQILNNLLSNAFKFTSPGKRVEVTVRQMGGPPTPQYQFVVKDTGIGMSEEFLPQLFEPYARETRFFSRQVVGTGLGMPIVKSLVTQMSGQIYVDSALGKGTTFTLTVPFITAQAEAESRQTREDLKTGKAGEAFSLAGRKILLAEDNLLNMEIANEILTMNGLEVLQAWNGQEAVELFQNAAPYEIDAILMDMQMPQMDGCEAARTIRAMERPDARTVPIIAVTANAFAEDIAATTAAGMNAHISKPIDFRALCATLEKLLGQDAST